MRETPMKWGGGSLTGGVVFDNSDFNRKFTRYMSKTSIDAAREGLGKGGEALMFDTLHEDPQAPELTSALRSAISVFVNRKFRKSSIAARKGELKPKDYTIKQFTEKIPKDTEQAAVVVNAPYAAMQHEIHHPGYFSHKLFGNAYKYLKIISDEIKGIRRA